MASNGIELMNLEPMYYHWAMEQLEDTSIAET